MTVNEHERYDRQVRLWGEKGQKKINNAVATIVGDGPIARDTAMSLTALGVGQIRLIGNSVLDGGKFLDIDVQGDAVQAYQGVLKKINPNVDVAILRASLESRTMKHFLEDSTAIIEATNDPRSKAITLDLSKKSGIPAISASSSPGYAKIAGCHQYGIDAIMPGFQGLIQDDLISLGIGGVITEEVKKIILGQKDLLDKPVYYNLGGERFSHKNPDANTPKINKELYKKLRAGVVGAGALANIACILLAKIGFGRVDYCDYDTVESHNLTRQINFYDCVGKPKAQALALKHKAMNPEADIRGLCEKFEIKNGVYSIEQLNPEGYDVIFDLVDNKYTRAMIAAYCVLKGIPLVSAASSPEAAQWAVYVPGKTPCLEHLFAGYYASGLEEEKIRRRSCTQDPNPAVIMTNQTAAAFAVLESLTIFQPEEFGEPFSGSFKYSTTKDSRLSTRRIKDACDCHTTKNAPDMEITEEMMRKLPPIKEKPKEDKQPETPRQNRGRRTNLEQTITTNLDNYKIHINNLYKLL